MEEFSLAEQMAVDAANQPNPVSIDDLRALTQRQVDIERDIAGNKRDLEVLQEEYSRVREYDIPNLFARANCTSFGLTDGRTLKVEEETYCNISEARREEAHAWLRANNEGDLIKPVVVVTLEKGDEDGKRRLLDLIEDLKYACTVKEAVHASTLKSFVKERLVREADPDFSGEPIPRTLFGIFVKKVTNIVKGKK